MIGETISHYRILDKLGEGGMGVVYKAEDLRLQRTVALKFLSPKALGSDEERSRFIHEARAAAALQHPNICTVHEIDEVEGKAFIAMAFIDGPSLHQRIARGPMTIDEVIDTASQLCQGLQEAHEKGIVHRDIKPANVMVDSKGRIAIMDFGLAKSAARSKLTQESTTLGTVAYMSPEQARGEKVDRRSDIWSLGVVIYQMVTGLLPFRNDHETALVYAILNEYPEPLTALRTGVPMELERIVDKAMTKDREERYQHVDEMLVDLRRLRSGASRVSRVSGLSGSSRPSEEVTQVIPTPFPSSFDPSRSGGGTAVTPPRRRSPLRIAVGVTAAALAAASSFFALCGDDGGDGAPVRVAIAPFDNQTGESAYDHLGRMAADWITRGLARTDLVEVVPLAAQDAAGGGGEGAERGRRSAAEKNVTALVSGSYYLREEEVEFHAQITDPGDGRLLTVLDPVRGSVRDPEEPIGRMQQRVMGALALLVDPQSKGPAERTARPPTYEALRAEAEGEAALARFDDDLALEHFSRAAAGDSTYAEPLLHAALVRIERNDGARADSLARLLEGRRGSLRPHEADRLDWVRASLAGDSEGAAEALRRAVEQVPEGRWSLRLAWEEIRRGRPREARELLDAIAAEPEGIAGSPACLRARAEALHRLGEHEQELEAIRRGRDLDPLSPDLILAEGRALAALGRLEDLNAWMEKRLASPSVEGLTPGGSLLEAARVLRAKGWRDDALRLLDRAIAWFEARSEEASETEEHRWAYARALYAAERWDEAWVVLETLGFDDPENPRYIAALGAVAARRGDRDAALHHLRALEQSSREDRPGERARLAASIYALLGDRVEALARLRAAADAGWSRAEMEERMDLEPLVTDPAFRKIIRPER
ncbi:MAG: protein kinase [Candidatus Eisenbacteria bacterium]|nr:protein kinase [Candidatus Eisenbacteria bacterium]